MPAEASSLAREDRYYERCVTKSLHRAQLSRPLVLCGVCCGLAGAQLSISNVSLFVENMSAGRGWIAVVIVLVTNGRPIPLLGLVLLFGFVDSLSLRLQGFGFPQQFTEMMPYIASLLALIFVSIRRMKNLVGMRGYDNG